MCKLQDKIKKMIVKNIDTNVLNKEWKECNDLDALSKTANITIIERKNIQGTRYDAENKKIEYKFIEYTKWESPNEKQCVAIGFNPATIDPNIIDKTNGKIINILKDNGYGSYILLNLYPQVSKNKDDFNEDDEIDSSFQETLIKILELLNKTKTKTLIFWGRTVPIPKNVFDILKTLQQNEILYMTIKKDTHSHYHPARINIDMEKVTDKYFSVTNQLTGKS